MKRALNLPLAADQRIQASVAGKLGELLGESLQGFISLWRLLFPFLRFRAVGNAGARKGGLELGYSMGQKAHYVETPYPLLLQGVDGERVGLLEKSHQEIDSLYFLLAGAFHVVPGGGQDSLQGQAGPRLHHMLFSQPLQLIVQITLQELFQGIHVGAGVAQDLGRAAI